MSSECKSAWRGDEIGLPTRKRGEENHELPITERLMKKTLATANGRAAGSTLLPRIKTSTLVWKFLVAAEFQVKTSLVNVEAERGESGVEMTQEPQPEQGQEEYSRLLYSSREKLRQRAS